MVAGMTVKTINEQAKLLTVMCSEGAIAKCRKCGCTLKSELDTQLHRCSPRETDALPRHKRIEPIWA